MKLVSSAFADRSMIPRRFTCDGQNISPPLQWSGAPAGTQSLVLLCDDPDAPSGTWHHWAAYDIPPKTTELAIGAAAQDTTIKQAVNDFRFGLSYVDYASLRRIPKSSFGWYSGLISGSLPAGVPADFYGRVAQASKGLGKVIVDTSGTSLKAALEVGVYLIKPNLREFQELAGIASADEASLIEAGRYLFDRYRIEIIALSMGSDGALLMSRDAGWRANGLPIEPASVSGAGDSFLGAMVWSLVSDGRLDMALRYGVAGGSAALLNPGTELCRVDDVHRLASEVIVTPIAAYPR